MDNVGVSTIAPEKKYGFEVPASSTGGTRYDMGSLVLFLVSNWYVNGETVLIDGGVSHALFSTLIFYALIMHSARKIKTLLRHPSSY